MLRETATGTDHRAIKAAIEALGVVTEAFAARRMDRSIAAALSGKRIEDLNTP